MGRRSFLALAAAFGIGAAAAKAPEIISKIGERDPYRTAESKKTIKIEGRPYQFRLSGPEEVEDGTPAEYTAQLETIGGLFDAWVLTGVDKEAGTLHGEPELYAGAAVGGEWVSYKTAASHRPFGLVVEKEFLDSVQAKIEKFPDLSSSISGFFEAIGLPYPVKDKKDEVISKMPVRFLSPEVERSPLMELNLISGGRGGYGSVKAGFKVKISGNGKIIASILANSSNIEPAILSGELKIKAKKKKDTQAAGKDALKKAPSMPGKLLGSYRGQIGREAYTLEVYSDRAILKMSDPHGHSLVAVDLGPDGMFDSLVLKERGKPDEIHDLLEAMKKGGKDAMTAAMSSVGLNKAVEEAMGRPLKDLLPEASRKK